MGWQGLALSFAILPQWHGPSYLRGGQCTKFCHDFWRVLYPAWAELQCNRFLADQLPQCSVLDGEVGELLTQGEGRVASSFPICSSSVATCDYSQEGGKNQHLNAILAGLLTHLGLKFEWSALSLISRLSVLSLIAKLESSGHGAWGCSPAHSQSAAVAMAPAFWVNFTPSIWGGNGTTSQFWAWWGSRIGTNSTESSPKPPKALYHLSTTSLPENAAHGV